MLRCWSDLVLYYLTDTTAAPAIQAQQAELERSRLQDALEHKIQERPQPEQLVQQGILPGKSSWMLCLVGLTGWRVHHTCFDNV